MKHIYLFKQNTLRLYLLVNYKRSKFRNKNENLTFLNSHFSKIFTKTASRNLKLKLFPRQFNLFYLLNVFSVYRNNIYKQKATVHRIVTKMSYP